MDITRQAIEIGPFDIFGLTFHPSIHWYGLLIVIGIMAATWLTAWLGKRDGENPDIVWNGVIWVVVLGVLGARLWSVFFPAGNAEGGRLSLDYITDLNDGLFATWSGGLSIFGAIAGGALGVILVAWRQKLNLPEWIDRVAIGLPLAQAIARWGNYVNQELYGQPTDLPWGIKIDDPMSPYSSSDRFHPLFLYESLWAFILCGLLFFLWTRRRQHFQRYDFLLLYLMGYSAVRFLLEFLRLEVPEVDGVNVSQITTAVAGVAALVVFIARHRFGRLTAPYYQAFGAAPRKV